MRRSREDFASSPARPAGRFADVGWRFTDDRFHDIGLRSRDRGRSAVPDGTPGRKAFKTPSLRELAYTAP